MGMSMNDTVSHSKVARVMWGRQFWMLISSFIRIELKFSCAFPAGFRVVDFILYNLMGGYTGMNRQELIIMLTVLAVGVCIIILILLNGLGRL